MLRREVRAYSDVPEEQNVSIFRVKTQSKKEISVGKRNAYDFLLSLALSMEMV
jgi:hypothetical protein